MVMRTNKAAVIWSCVISVVALICSLILHFQDLEYWSNLSAGIFASGVLTIMISIINYVMERRRTLEQFYSYAKKAAYMYNRFEGEGDLERSIDSILAINDFDYIELDDAYGDMCFLFRDKKTRSYIYKNIYEPTLVLRQLIAEKCFHFKEYRKVVNGNSRVMRIFVNEVAEAMMEHEEMKSVNEYGVSVVIKSSRNKVVEQLLEELDGPYYEIMYPHTKKRGGSVKRI
jgi:hypothetical protein